MSAISVRAATMNDYEAICALYAEADALHYNEHPDAFSPPADPTRPREFIEIALSDPSSTILVAESENNGAVEGMARVTVRPASGNPALARRNVGWVEELVVLKSRHRSGIGSSLMRAAREWCDKRGSKELRLIVWEFNHDAIAFYERLGYQSLTRTMRLTEINGNER